MVTIFSSFFAPVFHNPHDIFVIYGNTTFDSTHKIYMCTEISIFFSVHGYNFLSIRRSFAFPLSQTFGQFNQNQFLTCTLYFNILMKGQHFLLFFSWDTTYVYFHRVSMNVFYAKVGSTFLSHICTQCLIWLRQRRDDSCCFSTTACRFRNCSWNFAMIFINNIKPLNVILRKIFSEFFNSPGAMTVWKEWRSNIWNTVWESSKKISWQWNIYDTDK